MADGYKGSSWIFGSVVQLIDAAKTERQVKEAMDYIARNKKRMDGPEADIAIRKAQEKLKRIWKEEKEKARAEDKEMIKAATEAGQNRLLKVIRKRPGRNGGNAEVSSSYRAIEAEIGGKFICRPVKGELYAVFSPDENGEFNMELCGRKYYGTVLLVGRDGQQITDAPFKHHNKYVGFCNEF